MSERVLEPARTCLLLFDTLNPYLKSRDDGAVPHDEAAVGNMRRVVEAARPGGC